jgi:hypothetical protein
MERVSITENRPGEQQEEQGSRAFPMDEGC